MLKRLKESKIIPEETESIFLTNSQKKFLIDNLETKEYSSDVSELLKLNRLDYLVHTEKKEMSRNCWVETCGDYGKIEDQEELNSLEETQVPYMDIFTQEPIDADDVFVLKGRCYSKEGLKYWVSEFKEKTTKPEDPLTKEEFSLEDINRLGFTGMEFRHTYRRDIENSLRGGNSSVNTNNELNVLSESEYEDDDEYVDEEDDDEYVDEEDIIDQFIANLEEQEESDDVREIIHDQDMLRLRYEEYMGREVENSELYRILQRYREMYPEDIDSEALEQIRNNEDSLLAYDIDVFISGLIDEEGDQEAREIINDQDRLREKYAEYTGDNNLNNSEIYRIQETFRERYPLDNTEEREEEDDETTIQNYLTELEYGMGMIRNMHEYTDLPPLYENVNIEFVTNVVKDYFNTYTPIMDRVAEIFMERNLIILNTPPEHPSSLTDDQINSIASHIIDLGYNLGRHANKSGYYLISTLYNDNYTGILNERDRIFLTRDQTQRVIDRYIEITEGSSDSEEN